MLTTYNQQVMQGQQRQQLDLDAKKNSAYELAARGTNIMNALFEEKRNIAKEMGQLNEKRIEVIKQTLAQQGATVGIDDARTKEYINKNERNYMD